MNILKILFSSILLVIGGAVSLRAAEQPRPSPETAAKESKAKPYPLDFCIVSGEKFAGSEMKPFEIIHEGQTIKFCCKNCNKDFSKEPKKYLKKLDEEVRKAQAKKQL